MSALNRSGLSRGSVTSGASAQLSERSEAFKQRQEELEARERRASAAVVEAQAKVYDLALQVNQLQAQLADRQTESGSELDILRSKVAQLRELQTLQVSLAAENVSLNSLVENLRETQAEKQREITQLVNMCMAFIKTMNVETPLVNAFLKAMNALTGLLKAGNLTEAGVKRCFAVFGEKFKSLEEVDEDRSGSYTDAASFITDATVEMVSPAVTPQATVVSAVPRTGVSVFSLSPATPSRPVNVPKLLLNPAAAPVDEDSTARTSDLSDSVGRSQQSFNSDETEVDYLAGAKDDRVDMEDFEGTMADLKTIMSAINQQIIALLQDALDRVFLDALRAPKTVGVLESDLHQMSRLQGSLDVLTQELVLALQPIRGCLYARKKREEVQAFQESLGTVFRDLDVSLTRLDTQCQRFLSSIQKLQVVQDEGARQEQALGVLAIQKPRIQKVCFALAGTLLQFCGLINLANEQRDPEADKFRVKVNSHFRRLIDAVDAFAAYFGVPQLVDKAIETHVQEASAVILGLKISMGEVPHVKRSALEEKRAAQAEHTAVVRANDEKLKVLLNDFQQVLDHIPDIPDDTDTALNTTPSQLTVTPDRAAAAVRSIVSPVRHSLGGDQPVAISTPPPVATTAVKNERVSSPVWQRDSALSSEENKTLGLVNKQLSEIDQGRNNLEEICRAASWAKRNQPAQSLSASGSQTDRIRANQQALQEARLLKAQHAAEKQRRREANAPLVVESKHRKPVAFGTTVSKPKGAAPSQTPRPVPSAQTPKGTVVTSTTRAGQPK